MRRPALFFAVYLSIQIAVPIYKLFEPRPTRFGWQMFTASNLPIRVWIVSDSTKEISPTSFIGNYRSDLEWERFVPQHICQQTQARLVRYLMPLDSTPREFKC